MCSWGRVGGKRKRKHCQLSWRRKPGRLYIPMLLVLAQWLRNNHPDTDIILAGSHARAAEAAGDLCGSGPMLAKPYDPQLVLDRIKQLLATRSNVTK
jgi:hypothetical protein